MAVQIQRYDRLRMSRKARLDLFQIRGRKRSVSSESAILRLFGRVLERKRAKWGLHPLIHTLLGFTLALDVGISQDGCVRKRKPLDTLSRIEGLMKSPLTDTYHRYGWSQAYGDLGLMSPCFILCRIGDVAQLCQYEKPPFHLEESERRGRVLSMRRKLTGKG